MNSKKLGMLRPPTSAKISFKNIFQSHLSNPYLALFSPSLSVKGSLRKLLGHGICSWMSHTLFLCVCGLCCLCLSVCLYCFFFRLQPGMSYVQLVLFCSLSFQIITYCCFRKKPFGFCIPCLLWTQACSEAFQTQQFSQLIITTTLFFDTRPACRRMASSFCFVLLTFVPSKLHFFHPIPSPLPSPFPFLL